MRFTRCTLWVALTVVLFPSVLFAETSKTLVRVPVTFTLADYSAFSYESETMPFFTSVSLGIEREGTRGIFQAAADYSPTDKYLGGGEYSGESWSVSTSVYWKPRPKIFLGGGVAYVRTETSRWEKGDLGYFGSVGLGNRGRALSVDYSFGDDPGNGIFTARYMDGFRSSPMQEVGFGEKRTKLFVSGILNSHSAKGDTGGNIGVIRYISPRSILTFTIGSYGFVYNDKERDALTVAFALTYFPEKLNPSLYRSICRYNRQRYLIEKIKICG